MFTAWTGTIELPASCAGCGGDFGLAPFPGEVVSGRALTSGGLKVLCALVPAFRHLRALIMLAVWLLASQHCGLEAAGIIAGETSHSAPHSATLGGCPNTCNSCSHTKCNVVESGTINRAVSHLKAPAPTVLVCAYFVCLQLLTPDLAARSPLVAADLNRPEEWMSAWQFVRRAAPLARAPSPIA